jgi:hypothetical protein
MPGKQHSELISILETAANEPIGIVIATDNIVKTRAALYRARVDEKNPAYADLQFRVWPYEDGDLIICHNQRPRSRGPTNLGDIDLDNILDLNLE